MVFLKTYMSLKLDLSESFALQINCFSNRMVKYTKLGVLFTLTKSLDIEIFSDEIFCYLTFCPSLPPLPPRKGSFRHHLPPSHHATPPRLMAGKLSLPFKLAIKWEIWD